MLENLKKHFRETSKDVLDKEFQEIYNKYGNMGPTIEEYANSVYETLFSNKMDDFLYYGLFLDEQSKMKLEEVYQKYFCIQTLQKIDKIYLDHVTLLFNNPQQYGQEKFEEIKYILDHIEEDTTFPMSVIAIGRSEKALAFKVSYPEPFQFLNFSNKAHITIATINRGKPVESNYIENWHYIPPIKISGVFKKKRI